MAFGAWLRLVKVDVSKEASLLTDFSECTVNSKGLVGRFKEVFKQDSWSKA